MTAPQKCTFVWRGFVFIFSSASQLQEILDQVKRDKRLTEDQPDDRQGEKIHWYFISAHLTLERKCFWVNHRHTYTFSSTSSAMRMISKRITIFPECSRISASASATNSLCQSGVGLPGVEPVRGAVRDKKMPFSLQLLQSDKNNKTVTKTEAITCLSATLQLQRVQMLATKECHEIFLFYSVFHMFIRSIKILMCVALI